MSRLLLRKFQLYHGDGKIKKEKPLPEIAEDEIPLKLVAEMGKTLMIYAKIV